MFDDENGVAGGQGRTGREVSESANVLMFFAVAAIVLVVVLLLVGGER